MQQHTSSSMVELLVRMDCHGCERTIRKALSKVKGVHTIEVDFEQQKVTVHGYIDPMKVLRRVRRTGKSAELWNPAHQEDYELNYVHGGLAFTKTYNYYKHGFNNNTHNTSLHHLHQHEDGYGTMLEEEDGPDPSMFSDDNPHACSIM